MSEPISIQKLEVIGYATVLPATMLPTVVPPIFRLKENADIYLVPPFFINEGFLCNATAISQHEAIELQKREEITLFNDPIDAQIGYELWVDLAFGTHYELADAAEFNLRNIASEHITLAETALSENRLEDAERLSSIALSAYDRLPESFAIKAAVCEIEHDTTGSNLFRKLAEPLVTLSTFDRMAVGYRGINRDQRLVKFPKAEEAGKFYKMAAVAA